MDRLRRSRTMPLHNRQAAASSGRKRETPNQKGLTSQTPRAECPTERQVLTHLRLEAPVSEILEPSGS